MANQTKLELNFLMTLQILIFLLSVTSYGTDKSNGFSLKMFHRDSPDSPMYRPNMTQHERMKEYIEMSTARVKYLAKSYVLNNNSPGSQSPDQVIPRPTLIAQNLHYLIQVGIGTFDYQYPTGTTYHLVLDTGSDLTWTQCEGCYPNCFHQSDPYFPSYRSSTYRPFHSSNCPRGAHGDQYNGCRMEISYTEGSKVSAIMATEVFTFISDDGGIQPFPGVTFGCGIDMQNFGYGNEANNAISGIMGMGYGDYGFMQQDHMMLGGKFSYCLQSIWVFDHHSPMYLRFGNDVLPHPLGRLETTPLYRNPRIPSSYYINLQGISLNGEMLRISPSVFARKRDGTGGCVIDSGTATSWITSKAYQIFTKAVRKFIKKNIDNLQPMRNPEWGYEFCWLRTNNDYYDLPEITFHFENNARFVLDEQAAFFVGLSHDDEDIVCLPFFESNSHENSDITFFGVFQQINHRIIYDLHNSVLQFEQTDCSRRN